MSRGLLLTLALAVAPAACDGSPPASDAGGLGLDGLFSPPTSGYLHVSSYDTTGGNRDRFEVAPGDSVVLLDVEGPGVIRRLWMTVASRDPEYLRRIALEMYWDGESEPSVRAPLGDFFGNGFDRRHYAALPMGVSSGGFYSYLPMPFAHRARIVARNGTGMVIDAFYVNADVELTDRLPEPLATFHAWWHREPRTDSPAWHRVLDAHGSGRFVGMNLQAESHAGNLLFLEGDERFFVDGVFRGQGTGTEDYFNAGWYFDQGPFTAPYHGLVVKDDSLARIAAYRWHLPDPVPFHDSLRMEMEHGHANSEVVDMATTAYWYQTEPHRPLPPLPPPNQRRVLSVKIPPGAVTADGMRVAGGPGDWTLTVPVPRPDRYRVWVYPVGGRDGGEAVATLEGGRPVRLDLVAAEDDRTLPAVELGEAAVAQGAGDSVALHYQAPAPPAAVEPRPVRRFARPWSVVGPFANPQRIGTEYSPALDSVYGPERDPGAASYQGMGGRTVRWQPVDAPADGYLRLNPLFQPSDWVAAFARSWLYSPEERDAVLLLGADDAHRLWVNGEPVSERQGRNIAMVDDLVVPVHLRAGWNRVLIEVADLDGGWAFQLRAADPGDGLRWARQPEG